MAKNTLIRSSLVPEKQTRSVEFQISHLTNRILKLTYHLKLHGKDYSSQRGLWKILGKRDVFWFIYLKKIHSVTKI